MLGEQVRDDDGADGAMTATYDCSVRHAYVLTKLKPYMFGVWPELRYIEVVFPSINVTSTIDEEYNQSKFTYTIMLVHVLCIMLICITHSQTFFSFVW